MRLRKNDRLRNVETGRTVVVMNVRKGVAKTLETGTGEYVYLESGPGPAPAGYIRAPSLGQVAPVGKAKF